MSGATFREYALIESCGGLADALGWARARTGLDAIAESIKAERIAPEDAPTTPPPRNFADTEPPSLARPTMPSPPPDCDP